MKKSYLQLIAILPVRVILAGVNFYQDPANIFHDSSKDVADAILAGNNVYFGSANVDERKVKKHIIENMPKELDCIVIGPSLTLGIRKNNVGSHYFYNLSASGLNFSEIMAEIAMLELNQVKYTRLILCVDSYFFDETFAKEPRRSEWKPYTEYMLRKLKGDSLPELGIKLDDIMLLFPQIEQLFSVSYFQASCKYIQSRNSFWLPARRWGIVDSQTQSLAHYVNDGSWVYAQKYRNSTLNDVIEHAKTYNIRMQFAYNKHIDDYYKDQFKNLVTYLVKNGINLTLFLCPVCPSLWDRLEAESPNYMFIKEIEQWANTCADELGIKIIGSYNPYTVGISDKDFYDARHIRHDKLDDYFYFK